MTPLLLVGSLGTTTAMWDPVRDAFAERFDVHAFDLPGHGGAPIRQGPLTIEQIARGVLEHAPERFAYCGLSIGGMVGLWLGANAPDRVERAVVACTGAKLHGGSDYEARAELVRREGTGVVVAGARERWFTAAFRHSAEAQRILEDLAHVPAEGYASCCEAVAAWDFRAELPHVAVPTLALFGAEDPVTPPDVRETLADGVPGLRSEELAHAAHLAAVEQPEAFAASALAHLDRRSDP
ncbi:MAG TPA: alpha/beta fold hydrolase [Gaiellaceae bacterium]|nr:alpha/beta fold hydrolase [Gaiellaceae bacterium]